MTDDQDALMQYMSDLSEYICCAGWLNDIEHLLWRELFTGRGIETDCEHTLTDEQAANLLRLAGECGGWIAWRAVPINEQPETFVPWHEWTEEHREWQAERRGDE